MIKLSFRHWAISIGLLFFTFFLYSYYYSSGHLMTLEARDDAYGYTVNIFDNNIFKIIWGLIYDGDWVVGRLGKGFFWLFSADVCHLNSNCLTSATILLISFSTILIFTFMQQVRCSFSLSLLVALGWALSQTHHFSTFWQATVMDKLCAFNSILAVNAVVYFGRKIEKNNFSNVKLLFLGALSTLFLFGTYISKEHGILVTGLWGLILLFRVGFPQASYRNLFIFAAPGIIFSSIYGILFYFRIVRMLLRPDVEIFHANPELSLSILPLYPFNLVELPPLTGGMVWLGLIGLFILSSLVYLGFYLAKNSKRSKLTPSYAFVAWSFLAAGIFQLVLLKIHTQNSYYMTTDGIYIWLFLGAILNFFFVQLFDIKFLRYFILVALVLWQGVTWKQFYDKWFAVDVQRSENFHRKVQVIYPLIEKETPITFVYRNIGVSYLVVGTHNHSALFPFLFQDRLAHKDYKKVYEYERRTLQFLDPDEFRLDKSEVGRAYVLLDDKLNVTKVYLDQQELHL